MAGEALERAPGDPSRLDAPPGPRRFAPGVLSLATAVLIAAAAIAPRMPGLSEAITVDETRWIERSRTFAAAVADGRFADTLQTGHPGVSTMWIAGFAQRSLDEPRLRERYAVARRWMAFSDVALILLIWWLARGLLGTFASALGALIIALDPFLIAHNRVVHLDGLLALLMLASFLSLLRAIRLRDGRMLALSGALAGLALLTKVAAVFLVLLAAVALLREKGAGGRSGRLVRWLVWAGIVFVALWPAMWVVPWDAIGAMIVGAGGAAHEVPSGRLLVGDSWLRWALFYPASFLWRSTLVTLPGLVATALWAIRRPSGEGREAVELLAYALGFTVLATLAIKHLDRYLLPAFVAVDLAVAVGLARALTARVARAPIRYVRWLAPLTIILLVVHAGPGLALHPFELAHYNWSVGGPYTARHVLALGVTGEGLDRAAEDLNRLPGAQALTVAVTHRLPFEDFFKGRTVPLSEQALLGGGSADLVLFYLHGIQTKQYAGIWARYSRQRPLYTLTINGLPYVRVYRVIQTRATGTP